METPQPTSPPNSTSLPNIPGPTTRAATSTTVTEATISTNPTAVQGNQGSVDSRGSGNASIIDVVVTGGPHAGTYQRRSSEATCSANLTGNDSWGNQTVTASSSAGAQNFYTEVNEDQNYYIDNQTEAGADGTGTVKIQDNGNTATVTLDARTKDGKTLKANVECRAVNC